MNYEKGLVKKVMRVLLHLWTSLLHLLLSHLAKSPPKAVAALLQCNIFSLSFSDPILRVCSNVGTSLW